MDGVADLGRCQTLAGAGARPLAGPATRSAVKRYEQRPKRASAEYES
jgi:hypothetical protein